MDTSKVDEIESDQERSVRIKNNGRYYTLGNVGVNNVISFVRTSLNISEEQKELAISALEQINAEVRTLFTNGGFITSSGEIGNLDMSTFDEEDTSIQAVFRGEMRKFTSSHELSKEDYAKILLPYYFIVILPSLVKQLTARRTEGGSYNFTVEDDQGDIDRGLVHARRLKFSIERYVTNRLEEMKALEIPETVYPKSVAKAILLDLINEQKEG